MNDSRGSRRILMHGLALVMVGLLLGMVVPATPHPRLALGAHIQFITNGMLILAMATLLLTLPHRVGAKSLRIMEASACFTWLMAISEVANAWWGTKQTLPIAASQAGVSGGERWQELVVTLAHLGAGVGLIVAWGLLVVGFLRTAPKATVA